jgi:hypothetical protein
MLLLVLPLLQHPHRQRVLQHLLHQLQQVLLLPVQLLHKLQRLMLKLLKQLLS